MWTPYFCIIWPCPYSEIQWYISHNRLKRLDFSFGQSVFSFLMVNSKGGCSSILLQELPMRCSAINLVDSSDSPWGRLHGHIQTSCTFDSSHSRADTKLQLSVSYLTLSCLQNVKGLSLNPELHQIALVPQKTYRQALIVFIESYIGSFEATINSDFIQIFL